MDPVLDLSGVVKRYGSTVALRGVDLRVNPGETVVLLGPNGAGKTTVVDLILGLRQADAGRVSVLGTTPRHAITSGRVGAMLQQGGLPTICSVLEVLQLARHLTPRSRPLDELVAQANLVPLLRRGVHTLSGGEAKRVRFALAMVAPRQVVFLDEPTVAMDVEARRMFWAWVRREADTGCAFLVTTHYLAEADQFADRITVVHAGHVVADGTSAELKANAADRRVRFDTDNPDPERLQLLSGVVGVSVHDHTVELDSRDSDATLASLGRSGVVAWNIAVVGGDLEAAFLALTEGEQ